MPDIYRVGTGTTILTNSNQAVATSSACCCGTCPTVTLACDSINASRTKCGYGGFVEESVPPHVYLQSDFSSLTVNGRHGEYGCTEGSLCRWDTTGQISYSSKQIWQLGEDGYCTLIDEGCVDGGATFWHIGHTFEPAGECHGCIDSLCNDQFASFNACFPPWCYFGCMFCGDGVGEDGNPCGVSFCYSNNVVCDTNYSDSLRTKSCLDAVAGGQSLLELTQLSDEYTTDRLKEVVEGILPGYFGTYGCDETSENHREEGQNCTCFAHRLLSQNEVGLSLNRFKYVFKFNEPARGYLKIFWNVVLKQEHFDENHNSIESDNPAEWGCFALEYIYNCTQCDPNSMVQSPAFEQMEPESNGAFYIYDIRWSTDPNYTPQGSVCDGVPVQRNCTPAV